MAIDMRQTVMEVCETIGSQNPAVSHTRSLCIVEQAQIVIQTESRQAIKTLDRPIHHFETSLRIASSLNSRTKLSKVHLSMARLCAQEGRFDDAHTHVDHSELHAGLHVFCVRLRVVQTNQV